jgi:uncharacterized protein YyaL (SSP411 family)
MANRLAQESSPYLQQHKNNPVDWYPWGEEALAKAKAENKPILLSIGYSACHWCHVMEHESFENPATAQLMNENFVNIKVDREERPDLDQIYQNVAQLMTRSGGWPLTVFLTPECKPFFGGTYFPPDDNYGRPGFPRVLQALAQAYRSDQKAVAENALKLSEAIAHLEGATGLRPGESAEHKRPDVKSLRLIADRLLSTVDWPNGGLGSAPKFPNTMSFAYLWRFGQAAGFGMAKEATIVALQKMAEGGIYDQLGGGFHRYAVDQTWSVPHFEKMLYDNALLLKLYSEVLVTAAPDDLTAAQRKLFERTIEETTEYLLREMQAPEGAFYSTQDADSEGVEGKFFVWNPKELHQHLDKTEAEAFALRYGVTAEGNFEHGSTVLFLSHKIDDVASRMGISTDETEKLLSSAKNKLFKVRENRVKPGRDEKILTSWNALAVSGLAWAALALDAAGRGEIGERAKQAALATMEFLRTHVSHSEERLWSVFKDGRARFNAYLDDYAFAAAAAIDTCRLVDEATEVEALLADARGWIDVACARFADRQNGGFYFTSDDHEKLIARPKTLHDQAIPSGAAVAIESLLALGELFPETAYSSLADESLYKLFPIVEAQPHGMSELALAALLALAGPITVSGKGAAQACDHPHVFLKNTQASETLVCHRRSCSLPLTDVGDLRKLVSAKTGTALA